MHRATKVLAVLASIIVLIALVIVFFPWDQLRGPVNRYLSERTGRHFAITRKLDVKLGRTTRILADGIEFANPEWAKDPFLVRAESGEIDIRLWPLIAHRQFVLPRIALHKPELGLQMEADGRRSWALGRDTGNKRNVPDIGALEVDEGTLHFIDAAHDADIHTDFAIDTTKQQSGDGMPLQFSARGNWQKEQFTAKGRTGNVLYLSAPLQKPFPIEIEAAAGATHLAARGDIASLATLEGANALVDLKGDNLGQLYKLLGVVLPETPHYSVQGRVTKKGDVWNVADIRGRLGASDIEGHLSFDKAKQVPHLAGELKSQLLDFNDLAPVIGMQEKPRGPKADKQVAAKGKAKKPPRDPNHKVIPNKPIDLVKLKSMNAEVNYTAAKVTNVQHLPIERAQLKVRLENGVLDLEPFNIGFAGGTLQGRLKIDSHANPALVETKFAARGLKLEKLVRDADIIKGSFGRIYGDIDLKGRGNSAAQMLGRASGNVALIMGQGQVSNLLLELVGLDGREILKFLMGGDEDVRVRCAATSFDVKEGLMTSRASVFDTTDTVVYGKGTANLANEQLDFWLYPYPKDKSILSLRAPINIGGTFGAPKISPDKKALIERGAAAALLGVVNPLLALAATIETGPGEDAPCGTILKEAANPNSDLRGATEALQQRQEQTQHMGILGLGAPKKKNEPNVDFPAPAHTK
jgi:AsmA family protein